MDRKIAELVEQAGGYTEVARQLGVTKQAVFLWAQRGKVGAASVIKFARLVGVRPEELRPDMYDALKKGLSVATKDIALESQ